MSSIYVIGSMKNSRVPELANNLRGLGYDVFDDWYSPGPEADDKWQEYERGRGRTYKEAMNGYHAKQVFEYDKSHLERCDVVILVLPAGKSAHMELGYVVGLGKKAYILFDTEPERFDIMYRFSTDIFFNEKDLYDTLRRDAT